MLDEFGDDDTQKFPNIRQLVASFGVGQQTESVQMCKWLFPCDTPIEVRLLGTLHTGCRLTF